jgi:hypothetical protein
MMTAEERADLSFFWKSLRHDGSVSAARRKQVLTLLADLEAAEDNNGRLAVLHNLAVEAAAKHKAENAALKMGIERIAATDCLWSRDYFERGGNCKDNGVFPGCSTCQARALLVPQPAEPEGGSR